MISDERRTKALGLSPYLILVLYVQHGKQQRAERTGEVRPNHPPTPPPSLLGLSWQLFWGGEGRDDERV